MADYLDATRIRALAAELGLKPSKGRGQNFLFDANTVRRIVNLAQLDPNDVVLEIGPGLGSLTVGLLHTGAQVIAIEIESALAARLATTMGDLAPDKVDHLRVVEADALRVQPSDVTTSETASPDSPPTTNTPTANRSGDASDGPALLPTRLVANLPYNISVPVILHTLALFPSIERGLVMVQSEVADRLVAHPGSKIYGVPSAKLAWYADATRVGSVPATVFWPAPNVESGLVSFVRRDPPAQADRATVFSLIDHAFSQRRKMLRSVLASVWGPTIIDALVAVGISPQARGETLSIDDFARLARHITPPESMSGIGKR
ncbi:MAG: 16S rRNA (adenine(1518)-N(6)/adenine(1519)-N(6))-dimethyltransferase RsmA [Propionibacteriaceae bacterium]|jgi:16S rRNA (adenine1518-N6/adenine1519-N6)-dimethyltransferase|nr:16S rRNA (adenine(1518)-N(6)/adenine(1519)-N(6))-dimethyltransferase RsmA [Propionibacteriaceae bacterium]